MKTTKTEQSVELFLNSLEDEEQRKDAFIIAELMKKVSASEAKMWGSAIIGFGANSYQTADGKDHDWFQIGFSPRKAVFSFYLSGMKGEKHHAVLGKLGKHKSSKGCLYIRRLADIDVKLLQELLELHVNKNILDIQLPCYLI